MNKQQRLGTATRWFGGLTAALLTVAVLSGCSGKKDHAPEKDAHAKKDESKDHDKDAHKDHDKPATEEDIKAERDKLSPEDRKLVDAQDFCPIMPDSRLAAMGPPIKVTLKGETVFVCCKGCVKKAERKPDETLAKVTELKAKNKPTTPK